MSHWSDPRWNTRLQPKTLTQRKNSNKKETVQSRAAKFMTNHYNATSIVTGMIDRLKRDTYPLSENPSQSHNDVPDS